MDSDREHPIDPELAAAVRDLARSRGDTTTEPGERLAYLAGELGDSREDFEDRMVRDSETVASLRRLARFDDGAPDEALTADIERSAKEEAEDWRAIRARLEPTTYAEYPGADPGRQPSTTLPERRPPRSRWALRSTRFAVAALLVTVVGLTAQVLRLEQRLAELEGPATDVGIVTLRPADTATRAGGPPVVDLGPGGRLVVVLSYTGFEPFESHGVLLTQADEVLWRDLDLPRTPGGSFLLELSDAWLTERSDLEHPFELRLVGVSEDRQTTLAQYPLRIDRALRGQPTPQD